MGGGAFAFGAGAGAMGAPVAQRVPPDMNRAEMSMAGGGGAGGFDGAGELIREFREMKKIMEEIKRVLESRQDDNSPSGGKQQWSASQKFGPKSKQARLPDKPEVRVSTMPGALGALSNVLFRGQMGRR